MIPIPSKDPWEDLPKLGTDQTSGNLEAIRTGGDPSRFYTAPRGGSQDAVSGRVTNMPSCRVLRTGSFGNIIPSGNAQWGVTSNGAAYNGGGAGSVGWNTVAYDNDGMFSTANDERITARTPGMYLVGGSFDMDNGGLANGRRLLDIFFYNCKTATPGFLGTQTNVVCRDEKPADDGAVVCLACSGPVPMNAGDWISLRIYQNSGASIGGSPANAANWFQLTMYAHMISTFGSDN